MPYRVSKADFAQIVQAALDELPERFSSAVEDVAIEVLDRPGPRQLARLGTKRSGLLLGLYTGVPRTLRSVEDSGRLPDAIYLFQQNIETVCSNEADLIEQTRVTLLHEIGHYFGMDEGDLTRLGYG